MTPTICSCAAARPQPAAAPRPAEVVNLEIRALASRELTRDERLVLARLWTEWQVARAAEERAA